MILESSRLRIEVAEPGSCYRGSRFDRTFIVAVEPDGRHRSCSREAHAPGAGRGGIGLRNEFGLDRPLGYDEAAPGEQFPKLGIGLLTRPDGGRCDPMRAYAGAPSAIASARTALGARWTVGPRECRGYAVRLHKQLGLAEAGFTLSHRRDNLGRRELSTSGYDHNSIAIDGHGIGPEYRLSTSAPIAALPGARGVAVGSAGFRWEAPVAGAQPFSARCQGVSGQQGGLAWILPHLPSGVGLSEGPDRPPALIGPRGMAQVVSPELFVAIELAPGASMEWRRAYRFSAP